MKTFADFLQEALITEALAKGEVWGVIDGKYYPCNEKTMKVLRGPQRGTVAKPANSKKPTKLEPGEEWVHVKPEDEWLIVDKEGKVVGGNSKYHGKIVFDGKFVKGPNWDKQFSGRYVRAKPRPIHYYRTMSGH